VMDSDLTTDSMRFLGTGKINVWYNVETKEKADKAHRAGTNKGCVAVIVVCIRFITHHCSINSNN
jgi:hypothetical protein